MRRLVQMSTQTSQWFTETVTADVILSNALTLCYSANGGEKKTLLSRLFLIT